MLVRANIDPKYVRQFLLTAAVFFAFALWFLFDGLVTYPRQRERALAYQELVEEDRGDEWEQMAAERGWPTKDPGDPKEELDIQIQLVLGGIAALPGLWFVIGFFRVRRRWIEMDENGLQSSLGQKLEFDQIEALDKRKWRSKGIAKISYRADGRRRRLVLDDWKYDRKATETILRGVESHLAVEQITGGSPEPPPEEEPADADSQAEASDPADSRADAPDDGDQRDAT